MSKHKTRSSNSGSQELHSVNEIWPVYVILQKKKKSSKSSSKTATWTLVPGPLVFTKN